MGILVSLELQNLFDSKVANRQGLRFYHGGERTTCVKPGVHQSGTCSSVHRGTLPRWEPCLLHHLYLISPDPQPNQITDIPTIPLVWAPESIKTGTSENYWNFESRSPQCLLVNNHYLSTKCVPGTALNAKDSEKNKTAEVPALTTPRIISQCLVNRLASSQIGPPVG